MKIIVLTTVIPFVRVTPDAIAQRLVTELRAAGHETELVRLPAPSETRDEATASMLAFVSLRVSNSDRVIALSFPACLVRHPEVVVWLAPGLPQVSDFVGSSMSWPEEWLPEEARASARRADAGALTAAAAVFCGSPVTADLLRRERAVAAEVLIPPPQPSPGSMTELDPTDPYLLAMGAEGVESAQSGMVLEALHGVLAGSGRLVLVGLTERARDLAALRSMVTDLGLADRVKLLGHAGGPDERRQLLAGARAVIRLSAPVGCYEDLTVEAAHYGRPVVVTPGAPYFVGLIEDAVTGMVPTTVEGLAAAFDRCLFDAASMDRMGSALRERFMGMSVTWPEVAGRLSS